MRYQTPVPIFVQGYKRCCASGFALSFARTDALMGLCVELLLHYEHGLEVKAATRNLSREERWEVYRWLSETEDVRQFRHDELRREITVGIEQADHGEAAPLDIESVKKGVRQRLKGKAI